MVWLSSIIGGMRKIVACLAVAVAVALAGCGESSPNKRDANEPTTSTDTGEPTTSTDTGDSQLTFFRPVLSLTGNDPAHNQHHRQTVNTRFRAVVRGRGLWLAVCGGCDESQGSDRVSRCCSVRCGAHNPDGDRVPGWSRGGGGRRDGSHRPRRVGMAHLHEAQPEEAGVPWWCSAEAAQFHKFKETGDPYEEPRIWECSRCGVHRQVMKESEDRNTMH